MKIESTALIQLIAAFLCFLACLIYGQLAINYFYFPIAFIIGIVLFLVFLVQFILLTVLIKHDFKFNKTLSIIQSVATILFLLFFFYTYPVQAYLLGNTNHPDFPEKITAFLFCLCLLSFLINIGITLSKKISSKQN